MHPEPTIDDLETAAKVLAEQNLAGQVIAWPAGLTIDERIAYDVQRRRAPLLSAAGRGTPAGYKVGGTTAAMRQAFGLTEPCSGRLFATELHDRHGVFVSRGYPVAVECEIVVWLGADLPGAARGCGRPEAAAAVAACGAAIEVVENRYGDLATAHPLVMVADDFFARGAVVGERRSDIDLARLDEAHGTIWINGAERASGQGSELLGHPLDALDWLANARARLGTPLRAGEMVMLGSLVAPHWVEPGSEVRVEVEPLGSATMQLVKLS